MNAPVDADSDSADERDNVLKTLTEREVSTPELVQTVLSQVHSEFALWNAAYCHQTLTSFTAPSTWQSCLHPDFRLPSLASMAAFPSSSPETQAEANSLPLLVSLEVYSPNGAVVETSVTKLETVHLSPSLDPYPPYESCSPLHRSIFKGDDSDDMDFIPYADEHTFDQINHIQHYETFSWQNVFDPDLEVISLEAVYRLQIEHGLTYNEIEDSKVLPLGLRSRTGTPGLLSAARRRDRLQWEGNTIPKSHVFPSFTRPNGADLRNRLGTLNSLFCPNLSCMEPLCNAHVELNPMSSRSYPPSSHVLSQVMSPCRNQCFMNDQIKVAHPWEESEIDMLRVVSDISLDTTPCDLAVLCLKPCNEVYYYRKLLYSHSAREAQPESVRTQRRILKFNGNQCNLHPTSHATIPALATVPLTAHVPRISRIANVIAVAPKNATVGGKAVVAQRASLDGAARRTNVHVLKHSVNVTQNYALTAGAPNDTPCRNSQIQRGGGKKLEVKRSNWGLGTFLAEAARADDLITEYIGEIIYEPTVESRADLATHRNRCYVFGLNKTLSLDATYAGNISRFIDHSDRERIRGANSQAQVRLINGEHRIGIFAIRDMEAGSPVLMNYGSFFFVE